MPFEGSKLEYTATVDSLVLKDEAKLSISADGIAATSLFNQVFIDFADVVSFAQQGYSVAIATDYDQFTFEKLGNLQDAFYLELYQAFNAKVRQALFIKGDPEFVAQGEFQYTEPDGGVQGQTQAQAQSQAQQGQAQIEVYDDCVCVLPSDDRARRIPFAFADGLQKGDFELTLTLDGGQQYRFIRLGNNTDAFEACIRAQLHTWRENALDAVRALDGSLNPAQLNAVATLMPQGVAVALGQLQQVAPSCVAAIEAKIAASRAADTYTALKEICEPDEICVGMKTELAGEQEENILWFIALSKTKPVVAVELALDEDTAAATFIYNSGTDRSDFIRQLNRAMEAIDFHREVISMSDDDLNRAENSSYRMAVKRTAALRFMRQNLAGRVIHSSLESWTTGIRQYLC